MLIPDVLPKKSLPLAWTSWIVCVQWSCHHLPQNIASLANTLPQLPSDLDIIVVAREGRSCQFPSRLSCQEVCCTLCTLAVATFITTMSILTPMPSRFTTTRWTVTYTLCNSGVCCCMMTRKCHLLMMWAPMMLTCQGLLSPLLLHD